MGPRAFGFLGILCNAQPAAGGHVFSRVLAPKLVNINNFRAAYVVLLLAGCAIPFLALRFPKGLTV